MRTVWMVVAISLAFTGSVKSSLGQCCEVPKKAEVVAATAEKASTNAPAKAAAIPATKPTAPKEKNGDFVWSKTTFRLGMTMTEGMAEIAKSPVEHWYAVELDARPHGELHKMDRWVLAYTNPSEPELGGGAITLVWKNGKLANIEKASLY